MKSSTYNISIHRQFDYNFAQYAKLIVRDSYIPLKTLLFYIFCPIFDNKINKIGNLLKCDFATENDIFPKVHKSSNPNKNSKLEQNESRL